MSYQEMRAQDDQAHEDGMAIAAGTMCSFCLSVMHVATSYDTCPRIQQEEAEAARLKKDADLDAYWKQQEGKPDFTCTNCKGEFFIPHEGFFLDIHDSHKIRDFRRPQGTSITHRRNNRPRGICEAPQGITQYYAWL